MKLYRAFATVGGLTLVSRIMGFARDIAFAALLGAGPIAEAFVIAFRFPNLFRRWFGEGAFNSAFVPLFAKKLEGEGREAARTFASDALAGLAFVLLVVSLIAMIAMPLLMYVLAPGFSGTPWKFDLAVTMSQIAFPYLFCMSMVALLSGVLNSLGKFVESSSISVVLNIVLMGAMAVAWWLGYGNEPATGMVLAIGILVAGVAQLVLLLDGVWRNNMMPRLTRPKLTPDVKRLVTLGVPGVIAGGVTQINIVIGGMVASLQESAVSWLFYADRLYELPLAIIGIAIGVVLLPSISRHLRAGDQNAVFDAQNRSLELALLLTVPASVALAVIPREIISVLYERGAFKPSDTEAVASALAIFAAGLPSFVMIKVFSPAFFAREDTTTPMRIAGWSLVINTIGSVGLFFLFRHLGISPHLGIAVATTFGGWLNAMLLFFALKRRGLFVGDRRLVKAIPMIAIASAALGAALWFGARELGPWFAKDATLPAKAGALAILIIAASTLYFAMIFATGVLKPAGLKRMLKRG